MYDDIIHLACDQQLLTEIRMKQEAVEKHREYYLSIVNPKTNFQDKREKINNDLVARAYDELKLDKDETNKITYILGKYPAFKEDVKTLDGDCFTIGIYPENDISLQKHCAKYGGNCSRIHAFLLILGDNLILCDSWSISGTYTKYRSNKHAKLSNTIPNDRCIMKFHKNETIHLCLGNNSNHTIIINPKGIQYIKYSEHKEERFRKWLCDEMQFKKYYDLFVENGLDDLEIACFLSNKELINLGIDNVDDRNKLLMHFGIYIKDNFECTEFPNTERNKYVDMVKKYEVMNVDTKYLIDGYMRLTQKEFNENIIFHNIPFHVNCICAVFLGNQRIESSIHSNDGDNHVASKQHIESQLSSLCQTCILL